MAKKKERKIPEVLVFTDINNYYDDLASFVILAYLAEHGYINIKGIITELGVYEVRRRRAMYAKGAMQYLGQSFVRVVPGGDYEVKDEIFENNYPENEFSKIFEDAGMTILRSGIVFLQEYIKSVKDKNIFILLNAPFADFAKYIKGTQDTLKKKVKKIVVMGDVLENKTESGKYLPNPECFNFQTGYPAAEILFDYVQEKDVKTVLVPSKNIKKLDMDFKFLEQFKTSKNPVVRALIEASKECDALSMIYDMISALTLAEGMFKKSGGSIEKEEGCQNQFFFADVIEPVLMKEKIEEIFAEKFTPKKITLAQLTRTKPEEENVVLK
ncbi:MAG: nucleoside hydrolase [Alphaproteobacteria bacterium]|nr:nucleoside hydrolase [Alphaproteobacteria bacterium]